MAISSAWEPEKKSELLKANQQHQDIQNTNTSQKPHLQLLQCKQRSAQHVPQLMDGCQHHILASVIPVRAPKIPAHQQKRSHCWATCMLDLKMSHCNFGRLAACLTQSELTPWCRGGSTTGWNPPQHSAAGPPAFSGDSWLLREKSAADRLATECGQRCLPPWSTHSSAGPIVPRSTHWSAATPLYPSSKSHTCMTSPQNIAVYYLSHSFTYPCWHQMEPKLKCSQSVTRPSAHMLPWVVTAIIRKIIINELDQLDFCYKNQCTIGDVSVSNAFKGKA